MSSSSMSALYCFAFADIIASSAFRLAKTGAGVGAAGGMGAGKVSFCKDISLVWENLHLESINFKNRTFFNQKFENLNILRSKNLNNLKLKI